MIELRMQAGADALIARVRALHPYNEFLQKLVGCTPHSWNHTQKSESNPKLQWLRIIVGVGFRVWALDSLPPSHILTFWPCFWPEIWRGQNNFVRKRTEVVLA